MESSCFLGGFGRDNYFRDNYCQVEAGSVIRGEKFPWIGCGTRTFASEIAIRAPCKRISDKVIIIIGNVIWLFSGSLAGILESYE